MYEESGPRRSEETRRRQEVRLHFEFVLEISPEEYADWAGIDPSRALADIDQYVTSSIPGLPGIVDTGAFVRWRRQRQHRLSPQEAAILRKRWTGGSVSRPAVEMEALPFASGDDEWS